MKKNILELVKEHKIIAILREIEEDKIIETVKALHKGGIRLLEITFDQKSPNKIEKTQNLIKKAMESKLDNLVIGAGTVTSLEEVRAAYEVGVKFVLAPNVNLEVIKESKKLGLGAIPGAMTPTEVMIAYDNGADIVKLFPAGNLGISYCKGIMAPINYVPMIAVGGVDLSNLKDFINIGFYGAGIGSNITPKDLIENNKFEKITNLTQDFINKTK